MTKEFELRFKRPDGIERKLVELGFQIKSSFNMVDVIFEKDRNESELVTPGYKVVRIRMIQGEQSSMELKQFLGNESWEETQIKINDPVNAFDILNNIMVPTKTIEKYRQQWIKDNIIICFDNVTNLGKFIEIEGEESKVRGLVKELCLDCPECGYGRLLYNMEREGKISFDKDKMREALKTFK